LVVEEVERKQALAKAEILLFAQNDIGIYAANRRGYFLPD